MLIIWVFAPFFYDYDVVTATFLPVSAAEAGNCEFEERHGFPGNCLPEDRAVFGTEAGRDAERSG